tara:strand:- start:531 stop:689 length:159 start_codon:yes stop_codon:yes gene_type:complete
MSKETIKNISTSDLKTTFWVLSGLKYADLTDEKQYLLKAIAKELEDRGIKTL